MLLVPSLVGVAAGFIGCLPPQHCLCIVTLYYWEDREIVADSGVSHVRSETCLISDVIVPEPAAGPPEAIELVELTYKLMGVLGENWTILGSCLSVPDHELVATEVEEKTLYRRINRLLKFWVNLSEDNDRKHLASVLSQVGQYNLGQYASEVLQKAPTMHSI